ncbi:hypothetical protein BJ166DRAFT_500570 [Pestalotiopsis sp. NC0098]|nr:hypothetical protein BJ166DRAFT_500570 [Pestalotiopsis sp. NC0098]
MAKRPRATQGVVATTVEPAAEPADAEIGADILKISADKYYDTKRKRDQQAVFLNDGDYEVYTEQEINEMAKRPRVFKEVAATFEEEILKSLHISKVLFASTFLNSSISNVFMRTKVFMTCHYVSTGARHRDKLRQFVSVLADHEGGIPWNGSRTHPEDARRSMNVTEHDHALLESRPASTAHSSDLTSPEAFDAVARYVTKVQGPVVIHDLTKGYVLLGELVKHATEGTAPEEPFLRKALAMYKCLDKDQKALFQYVSDLPFGLAQVSGCPGSGKNHSVGLVFAIMQHSYTNDQVLKSWSETETPAPGLELRDDLDFEELPPIELIQSEDYSHDLRSSSARDEYAERMKLYTAASPSEPEKSPDGNEADDSWNPNK